MANLRRFRTLTSEPTGSPIARRLAAALLISAAVHAVVASRVRAPEAPAPTEPIQATLVAVAEEPPPASAPPPRSERKVGPAPKPPRQPRTTLPPAPRPAPIIRRAETQPAIPPTPAAPTENGATTTAPSAPSDQSGPSLAEATGPIVAEAEIAVTPLRPERPMPPQGTIRFDLFYGANRFLVGRSELTWAIADGRYRLSTSGETVGLAALFYPFGMSSESAGRISPAGFEPDVFRVDRTSRKGEKQFRVEFDRQAGVARFSGSEGVREVPLRPASLDLLSLICQLSVVRLEPGPMQLNLTNGRKLDTYAVDVGEPEVVETPMGDLRAVYVKQQRKPGDEGIEVWLAVDFGYLPVRLRFTDRKGSVAGEQLVTAIQMVRG